MSNYTETSSTNLAWAMPLMRTGKFPLDRSDLFSSYADAVKYAAGNTDDPDSRGLCGTSYVGQTITVFENDVITCYVINAERGLQEIGSGASPVRGVDYWTDEDKAEIKSYIDESILNGSW